MPPKYKSGFLTKWRILFANGDNTDIEILGMEVHIYPGNFFGRQKPALAGKADRARQHYHRPLPALNGSCRPLPGQSRQWLVRPATARYGRQRPVKGQQSLPPSGPCRPLSAQPASLPPSGPCRPLPTQPAFWLLW